MNKPKLYDTIIIGSGLSGLTTALKLQKAGHRVLVIEKRSKPGGLCGTFELDGYEFVIACNDFGGLLERTYTELEVPVRFKQSGSEIYFDDTRWAFPISGLSTLKLFRYAGDLLRLIKGVGREQFTNFKELADNRIRSKRIKDLITFFSYVIAMPLEDLQIKAVKAEFSKELNYEANKLSTPIGGPGHFIEKVVETFKDRGGDILFDTTFERQEQDGDHKKVITSKGAFHSRHLVSSAGRWDQYPKDLKDGFCISMICIAVDKALKYPEKIHTKAFIPGNESQWLNQIDEGKWPGEFGFHIFKCPLKEQPDHYTMNIYFHTPRGMEDPSDDMKRSAESYIMKRIERMVPGLNKHLKYKRFISPKEFSEIHDGLTSHVFRYIMPPGFKKPSSYDKKTDTYHVGNSVYPPGEHGAGAALSGLMVADTILGKEAL